MRHRNLSTMDCNWTGQSMTATPPPPTLRHANPPPPRPCSDISTTLSYAEQLGPGIIGSPAPGTSTHVPATVPGPMHTPHVAHRGPSRPVRHRHRTNSPNGALLLDRRVPATHTHVHPRSARAHGSADRDGGAAATATAARRGTARRCAPLVATRDTKPGNRSPIQLKGCPLVPTLVVAHATSFAPFSDLGAHAFAASRRMCQHLQHKIGEAGD